MVNIRERQFDYDEKHITWYIYMPWWFILCHSLRVHFEHVRFFSRERDFWRQRSEQGQLYGATDFHVCRRGFEYSFETCLLEAFHVIQWVAVYRHEVHPMHYCRHGFATSQIFPIPSVRQQNAKREKTSDVVL